MSLDIKTVLFLNAIAAIVMGISILVTARTHPQIKGVIKWAWGCGAQSLAWVLILFRGEIPDFFSIVTAYTLLLLSIMLFYQALSDFKEKHFSKAIFYSLISFAFLIFVFATYIYQNTLVRTLTIAIIGASLSFLCSYLLFFRNETKPKIGERILGLGFFLIGLSPLITILSIFSDNLYINYIFPGGIIQSVNFAFIFVSLLILTSSFMLMINDKFMGEILRLATMDSLTEIYNRAAIERIIETEIDRSKRYELPMSLLLLDLDHFKRINDTYGHQVGDLTLKTTIKIISKVLREHDILGRFGGEEFTVLLPDTDLVNAHIVAERVREIVRQTPIKAGSKTISMTISIGFATLNHKTDDYQELFRRADLGLYKAKQSGRNRAVAVRDKNVKLESLPDQSTTILKPDSEIDIFKSNPNLDIPSIPKRS
jgi:diguanylate cyclase (GGDEF)-like protein